MKKFIRNQLNSLLRNQGKKAGIIPIAEPKNEAKRLAEVERLGIMDRDISGERKYNSMTQVASYLTSCKQSMINILDSSVQQCKSSFGFNMIERKRDNMQNPLIYICTAKEYFRYTAFSPNLYFWFLSALLL